jgi:serine/threonine-protein kinase
MLETMSDLMPKPGDWVGAYRIVRQIGKGGMGAVFEAVTDKPGEPRAAIKVLHARLSGDPEALARFLNEGRAIAAVDHPGIVRLLETGQLPSGACYIAMEYLDGETLGARLKRERRLGRAGLRIGSEVANALAAAHRRNIIHRDLKPSNIILVPVDPGPDANGPHDPPRRERAKLIDFGIAKLSVEDKEVQDFHTRTGTMLGTPVYMAPEQCRGVAVTDRTDVYSLGVMLYQALAGRPPFTSQADGDVLAMHILVPPPPLRQLEPAVPENVARFIESMLAKNGAERPSMDEVEVRLRELAEDPAWSQPVAPVGVAADVPSTITPVRAAYQSVDLPTSVTPPPRRPLESGSASLGSATGQSRTMPRGRRGLVLGASVGLVVLAITGAFLLRASRVPKLEHGRPTVAVAPPAPTPPTVAPLVTPLREKVHWRLTTVPPGATVLGEDGRELGQTPWERDEPSGSGEKTVTLRLRGYKEQQVPLSLSRSAELNLSLVSDPTATKKPTRKKGRPKGTANDNTIIDFKTNRPISGGTVPGRPAP